MKTIRCLMIIVATLVATAMFGQIQIDNEGQTKKNSEYKKEATYISWVNDGYYFKAADYISSKYGLYGSDFTVLIYLGQNADEVKESGRIIQQWFDKAKNDAFINVTNKNGQKVCLYKYNNNLYCSYGTELNCKAVRVQFGADMTAALAGVSYKSNAEREKLMANIEFGDYVLTGIISFKKEFLKGIKNFKEPGQVSQEYKQEVGQKVGEVRGKCKEKDLMEKPCVIAYSNVVRKLMQSDRELDWMAIDHMNMVILELTKSKSKISEVDLSNEVAELIEDSEIIQVFENYYSKL